MESLLSEMTANDDEAVERHFRQANNSWTRLHPTPSVRVCPRLTLMDYIAERRKVEKQATYLCERPGYSRCVMKRKPPHDAVTLATPGSF